MSIAIESLVLGFICLADLAWTLFLLGAGHATEANPVLRFYLDQGGTVCFAGAKALLFVGPLIVLERLRQKRPHTIRGLLRAAIALYLFSYVLGVAAVNS